MKNIIIIVSELTGGGAERVATNLATCLAERDNVTLVVEYIGENTYGSTVRTVDLKMPRNKGKLKIFWHLKLTVKLKKIKNKLGVTHSISFLTEPSFSNVLSKRKDKVIVSVRNKLSVNRNILFRAKEKWVFHKADSIVSLSEMVRYDLIHEFQANEEKVTTIYNPCYVETIKEKIREGDMSIEERRFFDENPGKIVLTAGRLVDQKGHWHLIRAFTEVLKKIPDAKLLILGQGENEGYLQELISKLKMNDNVILNGYKSNPYPYMNEADIFVFPSIFEGLGNILVECMACELPIISSDCQYGPKELLDPGSDYLTAVKDITIGGYGILVPPMDGIKYSAMDPLVDSECKLAEAVVLLLNDKGMQTKFKKKMKERRKDFNPNKITNQWTNLIESL